MSRVDLDRNILKSRPSWCSGAVSDCERYGCGFDSIGGINYFQVITLVKEKTRLEVLSVQCIENWVGNRGS